MLHCGERWTGRKHPAPIYALCRLSEFYLGDIQERRALRRFFRRALIAGPGDNMEGAKSDRVTHRRFKCRNAGRDLIQGLKYNGPIRLRRHLGTDGTYKQNGSDDILKIYRHQLPTKREIGG